MGYSVTRQEVVTAARSLLGKRFRHQGRDPQTGIDCVGLLVVVAQMLKYPEIKDVKGYRRVPSADVIRQTLLANCDEIPLEEVQAGDIYLMRIGGRKPRHAAIRLNDDTDLSKGIEPMLIHAKGVGDKGNVVIESVRDWRRFLVTGFRLRGLEA